MVNVTFFPSIYFIRFTKNYKHNKKKCGCIFFVCYVFDIHGYLSMHGLKSNLVTIRLLVLLLLNCHAKKFHDCCDCVAMEKIPYFCTDQFCTLFQLHFQLFWDNSKMRWRKIQNYNSHYKNRMHVHFPFLLVEMLKMSLSCFLYHCCISVYVLTSTRLKPSNATGYHWRLDSWPVSFFHYLCHRTVLLSLVLSSFPFSIPTAIHSKNFVYVITALECWMVIESKITVQEREKCEMLHHHLHMIICEPCVVDVWHMCGNFNRYAKPIESLSVYPLAVSVTHNLGTFQTLMLVKKKIHFVALSQNIEQYTYV